MGRLRWEMPESGHGAWVQHEYLPWTGSDFARVEHCTKSNGTSTLCTNTQSPSLTRSSVRFDLFGRPFLESTRLHDWSWNQRKTSYNAMGWPLWVSELFASGTLDDNMTKTVLTDFDPFGRPGTVTLPDGKVVNLEYSGEREVARTVGVAGAGGVEVDAVTTETHDRQGRLYKVTEPSGPSDAPVTTTYAYDVGNRLKSATTTSGSTTQTRRFTYDNRGFLGSETLPEKGTVTYHDYDAGGHVGRTVDGPNHVTYDYDAAGRLTGVETNEATPKALVDLVYADDIAPDWANGKLRSATRHNWVGGVDNPVSETYTYDGVGGRVSRRATSVEYNYLTQDFTWNEIGQLDSVTYPQSGGGEEPTRTVSYDYSSGYLTGVPEYASSITYSVNGLPYQIVHDNGVTDTVGLDPNHVRRVASISTSGAWPSNLALGPYAYDGAGNVKNIGSDTFVYDKVSRLTSGTLWVNGNLKQQTAVYDPFGNITSTFNTDAGGTLYLWTDTATNRLLPPAAYDTAGNMTSWGGIFTYGYDKLSRLQSVTNTSGLDHTYLYTADGERISDRDNLADPPTKTLTVRDLWGKVLRVYTYSGGTWTWTRDYVYRDGTLLTAIDAPNNTKRHFHLDHLGSPRLITNGSATTVATHTYYPFGLEAAGGIPDTERMKFTGHEREPYNHDYMHARHYNPATLRFLTPDLLRGDVHRPQSFNLFAYVGGNPINYVDPFGLWETFTGEIEVVGVDPCREDPWRCYLLLRSATWDPGAEEGPGGDPRNPPPRRPPGVQRVGSTQDVLEAAFVEPFRPCVEPYSVRWERSWNATHEALPFRVFYIDTYRDVAKLPANWVTTGWLARQMGTTTPLRWTVNLFRGMTLRGVSYTAAETGILAGSTAVAGGLFSLPAFEAGLWLGTTANVALIEPGYNICQTE